MLAETEEKVELIEIGCPQVLAALLESTSDEISSESGIDLINNKVEKL